MVLFFQFHIEQYAHLFEATKNCLFFVPLNYIISVFIILDIQIYIYKYSILFYMKLEEFSVECRALTD